MPSSLLHSNQIQKMMQRYLSDTGTIVNKSLTSLEKTNPFRTIYRVSLATDAVLSELSTRKLRPSLIAARSIVLRTPFLVAVRQPSVATIDLRRFLELVFWTIYFTDHPIEWKRFQTKSRKGFSRDIDKPISYCACRPLNFYFNYAHEYMTNEPSGISQKAIQKLQAIKEELNATVHPSYIAKSRSRIPPVDSVSDTLLKEFVRTQRCVFSQASILLAAFNRKKFDLFQPIYRAHFDWLVGSTTRKKIRKGPFGLS